MRRILILIPTIFKLGLCNVSYVAWYRFTLKSGIRKFLFPPQNLLSNQDFFSPTEVRKYYPEEWIKPLIEGADSILSGKLRYFAFHWKNVGSPPDWFLNPFTSSTFPNPQLHWTKIHDFNPGVGDIKNIWEPSRFEWVTTLARSYSVTGEMKYLQTLNYWLKDWAAKNPLNIGPNWKCGQEASIRVFNLLIAAYILNQHIRPTPALCSIIKAHLKRIIPNIRYALAQDNNHSTSEAAAIFIGGSWLQMVNPEDNYGLNCSKKGRLWLERVVKRLIAEDGSFAQHSANYHRLMLDTLSYVEFWRQITKQGTFSTFFYARAQTATNWLQQLTDDYSGIAPNLGANDGALLQNLHSQPYRDFRPSVQLAQQIFNKQRSRSSASFEPVYWLCPTSDENIGVTIPKKSTFFKSGYVTINNDHSWAFLRLPVFRFRPSHNDVFHFDLWYRGQNLLCDAGSYSYNPPVQDKELNLKSVKAHNTVCFDRNEQMPCISRFLMGNWLKAYKLGAIESNDKGWQSWEGEYYDNYKNKHRRKISANEETWIIEDTLTGNFKTATIGFNLKTNHATLLKNTCYFEGVTITFTQSDTEINIKKHIPEIVLSEAFVSEHYFQKQSIQRLTINISQPGTYKTTIELSESSKQSGIRLD